MNLSHETASCSYHELPLEGGIVSRCYLDYYLGLQFFQVENAPELRINTQFTLSTPTGVLNLDPEDPASMGSALHLVRRMVTYARTNENGRLELGFEGDWRLKVAPHPEYEAWELTSDRGVLLVALPGGGLAIWSAED